KTRGKFFERPILFGVVHVMSPELSRFRFLAVAGGKGMDFAAPFVGKLHRHVSQSTDADDSDTGGRGDVMNQEGRKDSNTATQERSHFCQVERVGQRTNPRPLRPNTIGETTATSDDGALGGGAKVLIARKTLVTGETTLREPAKADALSELQPLRRLAERRNRPGHFMSRNERVL